MKQRQAYDAELADVFSRLRNASEIDKIAASKSLVKFTDGIAFSSDQCQIVYKRLIGGLNTSNAASRAGFFPTLTEILRLHLLGVNHEELKARFEAIFDTIVFATQRPDDATRQEEKDYLLGRVLACHALLMSQMLFQGGREEHFSRALQLMWRSSYTYSWMAEVCADMTCQVLGAIRTTENCPELVQATLKMLHDGAYHDTPEGVAIVLEIRRLFGDVPMLKTGWKNNDPLQSSEATKLARILHRRSIKDVDGEEPPTKKQKIIPAAKPHLVWSILFKSLLSRFKADPDKTQRDFGKCWRTLIDDFYFIGSASSERKAVGFKLFETFLSIAPGLLIHEALSRNLIHCLISHSAQEDRYLHSASREVLEDLVASAKDGRAPYIFAALINRKNGGTIHFDQVSHTQTLQAILISASQSNVGLLATELFRVLATPEIYGENTDGALIAAADLLYTLACKRGIQEQQDDEADQPSDIMPPWLQDVIHVFARWSYIHGLAPIAVSKHLREKLFSLVSKINNLDLLQKVLLVIAEELENPETHTNSAGIQRAHDFTKSVSRCSHREGGWRKTEFLALYLTVLLLAHDGDDEAVVMLQDLQDYWQVIQTPDIFQSSQGFDGIFEIILSLCSNSSALCKHIAFTLWPSLTQHLNPDSLHSVLSVLEQKENQSGKETLFDANDASSDGVDRTEDSDVEMIDQDEATSDSVESTSSVDDEDEDEDNEGQEDEEDEAFALFNQQLASIVKTKAPNTSTDAKATDSDTDESMTSDQMFALDEQLSTVFAARRDAKKQSMSSRHRIAREDVLNFKRRVLDLLLILVKTQHASSLTLDVLLPLLKLVRESGNKQLRTKAIDVLSQFFKVAKKRGLPVGDPDKSWQLLDAIHGEALMFESREHTGAATRCSLFLLRVLLADGKREDVLKRADALYTANKKNASKSIDRVEWKKAFWTNFQNWKDEMSKNEEI